MPREGPRRHVGRRRLGRRRGARGRGRARGGRRAHGALARPRPVPHRLARVLLDRGRGDARVPPTSWASRTTCGTSPSGSRTRSWPTSSPSTRPGARPTRACAATSTSSSRRCSTRRPRWGSTPSRRATTRASRRGRSPTRPPRAGRARSTSCTALRTRRRTSPTSSRSWVPSGSRGRSSRSAASPRRTRSAPRRRGAACRSPRSRTPTTSASSPTATPRGFLRAPGRAAGEIVDADGAVLGEHDGAYAYTVGQRKGLGIDRPAPDGRPRYVLDVQPAGNRVVVGPAELLSVDRIEAGSAVWFDDACPPAGEPADVEVQVRAHGAPVPRACGASPAGRSRSSSRARRCGASRPGSRSSSTPGRACSGRARSTGRTGPAAPPRPRYPGARGAQPTPTAAG